MKAASKLIVIMVGITVATMGSSNHIRTKKCLHWKSSLSANHNPTSHPIIYSATRFQLISRTNSCIVIPTLFHRMLAISI